MQIGLATGRGDAARTARAIGVGRILQGAPRDGVLLRCNSAAADVTGDGALGEWIRDNAWGHHASLPCPIGTADDPGAVFKGDFRLLGIDGLRMDKASAFPRIPIFFIASTVHMFVERGSDVVIAAHQAAQQEEQFARRHKSGSSAQRNGLRGMSGDRRMVGAPAPLRRTQIRRLLRHLATTIAPSAVLWGPLSLRPNSVPETSTSRARKAWFPEAGWRTSANSHPETIAAF